MSDKKPFKVVGIFDTETTNIKIGDECKAFPILFIYNDVSQIKLEDYEPEKNDNISFYRIAETFKARIMQTLENSVEYIPVVCAYNLMFDLQPLLSAFAQTYKCKVCAQSSTHVYTFDLCDKNENILLRFWDTYFLEMRGLHAMGETAGLPKAIGCWDYALIRTPNTPLTPKELQYAKRDVQVIPAYLRFLLESNVWLTAEMFGHTVLTKTSIVRQMAKHTIGGLTYTGGNGEKISLYKSFCATCTKEAAQTFKQYALRKACFRGGFTFTSAKYAHTTQYNVCSLDVTSMHHLFINGAMQPQGFKPCSPNVLTALAVNVVRKPREWVLANYDKPFRVGFHACIEFTNVRLKAGSAFEAYEIGLEPLAKFHARVTRGESDYNECAIVAENDTRANGYVDKAKAPIFAYGKLMSANVCTIYMTELELYAFSMVYDFQDLHVKYGEVATRFFKPPDYVTLQSNMLFEQKTAAKEINKHYTPGKPYPLTIPQCIPPTIAASLKKGNLTHEFVCGWYNSTIKGSFNGIYGTMAMNEVRPEYCVLNSGELTIKDETRVNNQNFNEIKPETSKVLYTYGMRIVGGSRLHLVLAIELLFEKFGTKFKILGGDTDSIKASVDASITDAQILKALQPLHTAATRAVNFVQKRVRTCFPEYASELTKIGTFEIEKTDKQTGATRYPLHMECWNKARVSFDGSAHVTCAGLSKPENTFTIEDFINSFMAAGYTFEEMAPQILGYNVIVDNSICHALERTTPKPADVLSAHITDYLGNAAVVNSPESIALYNTNRILGDSFKIANYTNIHYQQLRGRKMLTKYTKLKIDEKTCIIEDANTHAVLYSCKRIDKD